MEIIGHLNRQFRKEEAFILEKIPTSSLDGLEEIRCGLLIDKLNVFFSVKFRFSKRSEDVTQ